MSLNVWLTNLVPTKYPQSAIMRLLLVLLLFTVVSAVSKHGRRKHYLVEIEDEVGRIYLIGTHTLHVTPHDYLNFICVQITFKL